MSTPTALAVKALDGAPSGSLVQRLAALAEVLVAFAVVHLSFRSLGHFTPLGRDEAAATLNFSTGAVMILFTVGVLLVCRRSFAEYGITASLPGRRFRRWPADVLPPVRLHPRPEHG